MKIAWANGKYDSFMEAIMFYSNSYAFNWQKDIYTAGDVRLSTAEMQVFESVVSQAEKDLKMTELAMGMGIPKSTFSRYITRLTDKGMLEKYHPEGNRKEFRLRPTEDGSRIYSEYAEYMSTNVFGKLFAHLDGIPAEYIEQLSDALRDWTGNASAEVRETNPAD